MKNQKNVPVLITSEFDQFAYKALKLENPKTTNSVNSNETFMLSVSSYRNIDNKNIIMKDLMYNYIDNANVTEGDEIIVLLDGESAIHVEINNIDLSKMKVFYFDLKRNFPSSSTNKWNHISNLDVETFYNAKILTFSTNVDLINLCKAFNKTIYGIYTQYTDYANFIKINGYKNANIIEDTKEYEEYVCFYVAKLGTFGGVQTFVDRITRLLPGNYKVVANKKNDKILHTFSGVSRQICREDSEKEFRSTINFAKKVIFFDFSFLDDNREWYKNLNYSVLFVGDTKDICLYGYYGLTYNNIKSNLFYNDVVVLGENNLKLMTDKGYFANISAINLLIDKIDFKEQAKNNKFLIITRFENSAKNLPEIIKLCKIIDHDIEVDIYGGGSQFENYKQKLSKHKNINLKGTVSNDELRAIFGSYKALIVISESEGIPTIILESFMAHVPVISYDRFTSVSELIDDTVGKIVPYGKTKEMAKRLCEDFVFEKDGFEAKYKKFEPKNNELEYKKILNI